MTSIAVACAKGISQQELRSLRNNQDVICKVLERAGLISRSQDAQRRPRRLEAKPLAEASQWLEGYRQFWETSFQRLDGLLDEMKATHKKSKRTVRKKG